MLKKLTIVAPGLLGTSLAMAAHERSLASEIAIYARRQEAADALSSQPYCQLATTDLSAACADASLIVLCAPVDRIISLAEEIATFAAGDPVITDVGSVKSDIVRRCQSALSGKARFVGSHPMAGSEKTGMDHATADLFQDRICFVTPHASTDRDAQSLIVDFWKAVGSTIIEESPETHDEIVAQVSHLPHLLATSLATYLSQNCPQAADYCGNGLRDTTRVAAGSPDLWREIIRQNRPEILRALRDFQDHLQSVTSTVANENDFELLRLLADGKTFRDQL